MQLTETSSFLTYTLLNAVKNKLGDTFSFARDFNGLQLKVTPSGAPALHITDLRVDEQGINGSLSLDVKGHPTNQIIPGFTITLTAFEVALHNGAFSNTQITGQLHLPYFEVDLDVEIGVQNGGFSLSLATHQSAPNCMTPDGHVQLELPGNLGEIVIDILEVSEISGEFKLKLSGALTLSVGDLSFPTVAFKDLWIDNRGHVELEGGWINLPNYTAIDFYDFYLELKRLGIGRNNNGQRFIGLNGELHLVEGLPLGGSVRGLVINLDSGDISFDGVAVDFTVPEVLSFSGEVNFLKASTPDDVIKAGLPEQMADPKFLPLKVFFGGIRVDILAIPGLSLDARLIVGKFHDTLAFFLAFDAELPPPGIVLFPGISLYGINGLFASSFRPDPQRDRPPHTFWEWYKYSADYVNPTTYTVSDPNKWLPYVSPGAIALGAGGTIGTSDDGFAASANVTLVLMFPGPVISLMGRAKLLSTRSSNPDEYESLQMEAMATYDAKAETFDLNIDARYQILKLIDIEGSAAVHAGKDNWYFALGLPPRDKRIRARILDIFESDAYFVISSDGVVFGSYAGYNKSLRFGPFGVSFNVYAATIGAVQWSPLQFGGGIEMHGEVHVSAFGVGLGLTIDTLLEGTAPNPFYIHGSLDVTLELPWPLPDLHASVDLTWGPDGSPPDLPKDPSLVEATMVEHYGTRDSYVLPSSNDINSIPVNIPVIPQDAHFTLRLPRPTVNDIGFPNWNSGVNTQVTQASLPGKLPKDDMSNLDLNPQIQWVYQRRLLKVELYQQNNGTWQLKATQPAVSGVPTLLGSWIKTDNQFPQSGDVSGVDDTVLRVIHPGMVTEDTMSLTTGILPEAPGLYALKVVTRVEGGKAGETSSQADINEFFYFQTGGGPGLVHVDKGKSEVIAPDERAKPPRPQLSASNQTPAVSPWSGPLLNLSTYVQWSYPDNGAATAYYGYDVSVEFNEIYVQKLYQALGRGDVGEALHFRCVDRNHRHVILDPIALHLPAIPPMSALVAEPLKLQRSEQTMTEALRFLWPRSFQPQTRYTLDVVPGPSLFDGFCLLQASAQEAVEDLQDYYDDEDKLPTLARVEFTTSRYPTFQAHLAKASTQPSTRKYLSAGNPLPVINDLLTQYQTFQSPYTAKQAELAASAQQVIATAPVDPIKLTEQKTILKQKRQETETIWQQFSSQVSMLFDRAVQSLGRSDLTSNQHAPLPLDTELSAFALTDNRIVALLLESPEPLPWRRVFRSIRLNQIPMTTLWNIDDTRALLLIKDHSFQSEEQVEFIFQGNLGAEISCVTHCGEPITESVTLTLRF
jgi:hypothetical protein